jgi:LysR family glycine cleavage system transcriptional activator
MIEVSAIVFVVAMRAFPSTVALQAFEAAARSLSFQKAAQSLYLTPGAVSRQIQALERSLGAPLFSRHHRRVELTDAGRRFLADVAGPLEALAAAVGRARAKPDPQTLSVFAYPAFAIRWLMPRWVRFHDRHPDVNLRLTTSVGEVDFAQGEYDVALAIAPRARAPARLVSHDLLPIDLFPVCAPALASKLRRPADLARVTLLHGAPRPQDWRRWLEAAGLESIAPAQELRFDTLTLAYQAAIEGLGVAIGIAALVEQDLRERRLVRLFRVVRRARQPFQVLYPAAKAGDPRLQAFRDWVLAEAGAQ